MQMKLLEGDKGPYNASTLCDKGRLVSGTEAERSPYLGWSALYQQPGCGNLTHNQVEWIYGVAAI